MVTCIFIYNFYVFINKVRNTNCSKVESSVNNKHVTWIGFQELLHVFHLVSSITNKRWWFIVALGVYCFLSKIYLVNHRNNL
jgi:hypothetical protein